MFDEAKLNEKPISERSITIMKIDALGNDELSFILETCGRNHAKKAPTMPINPATPSTILQGPTKAVFRTEMINRQ